MKPFVDNELRRLEDLSKSGRACLVVIKGRRRIGKSRLAEEFGKDKVFLPFSGLAPVKVALPKGLGISPVLLHLGPVSDALLSSRVD
jgi:hypothetical protein